MASKGTGTAFSRKSYRLTSDAEKSRVTGKGWKGWDEASSAEGRRRKRERQQSPRCIEPQAFLHLLYL